jgi:predicted membrane-bound spermidine synthase
MATQPVPEFESDPVIYRIVVGVLGALVLIVALGAFVLMMFDGKDITQGVLALGSAAVGGLVGVLIPSPIVRKNNAP